MRIIFMGTPEFAVPSLRILVENGYDVACVVTQKDRPRDRGQALKPSPVKMYAVSQNIPVLQPERLSREPEMVERLKEYNPDLFVTCAFGQILPVSVLEIPRLRTVNVHGSLLPKYRGAAPIQWAIINGETKTGITTMLTDAGMDTGDMLLKAEIDIDDNMTAGELHDKMSLLGARTLLETLKRMEDNTLSRIPQDDALATMAPRLGKEAGLLDWTQPSKAIHNRIRGTNPWPGAFTFLDGSRLRIWRSCLVEENVNDSEHGMPGTILSLDRSGMTVRTGDGRLLIAEIQAESGKRMSPWDYALGHELKPGMELKGYDS
jgi:methionyl-tRNA formyltransferase